jgi:hypothetical protein
MARTQGIDFTNDDTSYWNWNIFSSGVQRTPDRCFPEDGLVSRKYILEFLTLRETYTLSSYLSKFGLKMFHPGLPPSPLKVIIRRPKYKINIF